MFRIFVAATGRAGTSVACGKIVLKTGLAAVRIKPGME
jgi:hypothetical protein